MDVSLFDQLKEIEVVKHEAIDRVESNASHKWLYWAKKAVSRASQEGAFTSDDVWHWLEVWDVESPREPRALGAVIRKMARDGQIRSTGDFVKSTRAECHGRPVAVWRSK